MGFERGIISLEMNESIELEGVVKSTSVICIKLLFYFQRFYSFRFIPHAIAKISGYTLKFQNLNTIHKSVLF